MSLPKPKDQRTFFDTDALLPSLCSAKAFEPYKFFADKILPMLRDLRPQLEKMYCRDNGRPAYEPVTMLGMSLLQFMDRQPDRQAVDSCTCDLRWKVALGLELTQIACHSTGLVRFRQKLVKHDMESVAFEENRLRLGVRPIILEFEFGPLLRECCISTRARKMHTFYGDSRSALILLFVGLSMGLLGCDHEDQNQVDAPPESVPVPTAPKTVSGPLDVYYSIQISDTEGVGTGPTPYQASAIHFYDEYIVVESANGGGKLFPLQKINSFRWEKRR